MKDAPLNEYPLMQTAAGQVRAASGRPLSEINLETLSELSPDDLQIHADTLRAQAAIARQAGYTQLAANLSRAAELTAIPSEEILKIYELLRPERADYDRLMELSDYLETTYDAVETAQLARQAAAAYRERGLLRR